MSYTSRCTFPVCRLGRVPYLRSGATWGQEHVAHDCALGALLSGIYIAELELIRDVCSIIVH